MANYFGINNDYSTLFSSLNNSSTTGVGGLSGLLSDYSSIKNGSYRQLLNAYYGKNDSSTAVKEALKRTSLAKDDTKTLNSIKNASGDLKKSVDALNASGSKSVFKKEKVTDKDGNTSVQYNTDKIYDSVKAFVDDYNTVMEATEKSNTASIANSTKNMITYSKVNEKMLNKIGITINSDSTLSLDEDKFKKADMDTVKDLFGTVGSYGYQVGVKASMVNSSAATEVNRANTYNSTGSYNYNYTSGDIYNSLF